VAGTRITKANGATRVIPGSHLWDYTLPPQEEQTVHVELQPGDAFMTLGGLYHAASANTTVDEDRVLLVALALRAHLRQEENAYLTYAKETIAALPLAMQRFFGFSISQSFLGYVDLKDPLHLYSSEVSSDRLI